SATLAPWQFETASGRRTIDVAGNVSGDNAECLLQLALMGTGIVRMNESMVGEEFRKGTLVPFLAAHHCTEPLAINALYRHDRLRLPRVKAMLEFLVDTFKGAPWRVPAKTKRIPGLK
ncbi:MAG: hypothetical protein V7640_3091, partial [Betaproteobacteria bacterium]